MSSFTFLLLSLSDLSCNIHFACAFKLFGPSVFPPTMTSADFSLFVITTSSLVRPHGISPNTFIVYLQNLRFGFTVTFLGLCYLWLACPPVTPYILFLFIKPRFRYPFFSPRCRHLKLRGRY